MQIHNSHLRVKRLGGRRHDAGLAVGFDEYLAVEHNTLTCTEAQLALAYACQYCHYASFISAMTLFFRRLSRPKPPASIKPPRDAIGITMLLNGGGT